MRHSHFEPCPEILFRVCTLSHCVPVTRPGPGEIAGGWGAPVLRLQCGFFWLVDCSWCDAGESRLTLLFFLFGLVCPMEGLFHPAAHVSYWLRPGITALAIHRRHMRHHHDCDSLVSVSNLIGRLSPVLAFANWNVCVVNRRLDAIRES